MMGNAVTVNVICAIAKELAKTTPSKSVQRPTVLPSVGAEREIKVFTSLVV